MKNNGKRIIIVGASSGLGERIARDFAQSGWLVGIAARRENRLKEIALQNSGNIVYAAIDVTRSDAVERFESLIESCGGMDVLLYCAGVGYQDPEIDPVLLQSTLDTNVSGFAGILTAAYKYFRQTSGLRRGHIAAITSIAGTKGIGLSAAYSSSKRFEQTYIDALEQLAFTEKVNVTFTDIRPGFVRTDLLNGKMKYPMEMTVDYVAPKIESALLKRRRVAIIDWRWAVVVFFWRLIPRWLWKRMVLSI